MTRKTTLILSAAITAFVLVIIGAAAGQFSSRSTAAGLTGVQPAADQAQTVFTNTSSAIAEYPVSAQMAESLAQAAAPNAQVQAAPELVSFQGSAAYEVVTNLGKIYVDAYSGQVLYNGAMQQIVAQPGQYEEHDDHDEHGEHESGDHD